MTAMATTQKKTKRVLKKHIKEKLFILFFMLFMFLGAADSADFGAFIVSKIIALACFGVALYFAPEEMR